ncbi:MFS transporter [Novosphingobium flavum]|uniref:MFS transporter n=1 Tax=Novosphingobium flavum TaxID=1778672 RepID=A0A7X1FTR7_9SPHN|nr:MFS transporter [Novosphingobium flavum]MBC2666826.1 MFS transporter [Novosphingobium flavum]
MAQPTAADAGTSPFAGQSRLTGNQRLLLALVALSSMLEFWDAYLIGFIMSYLVKPWELTYGLLGIILLASGLGAIAGGAFWGAMADRMGRKPVFVASVALTGLASVMLAFTPERSWQYMALMRVIIGFGTGGFFVQISMIHEFLPPRRRAALTGLVSAITTIGLLLGAASGAFVVPLLGWRGTFALGGLPVLLALAALVLLPESPRWLLLGGREAEARAAVAWARGGRAEDVTGLVPPARLDRPGWFEIFGCARSAATAVLINLGLIAGYYGIVLWSPTLLAQIQRIGPAEASRIMIGFSLLGFFARLSAAFLADRIGRRLVGGWFALGGAGAILLAGLVGSGGLGSQDWFWLPLLAAFVLADGSFSVCAVYSTEIWPSRLRGSGSGLGGMAGSLGKIIGPMGLGVIAGSSSVVAPAATAGAVGPAFAFLAACLLLCALTYLLLGVENRGRSLEEIDAEYEAARAARAAAPSAAVQGP